MNDQTDKPTGPTMTVAAEVALGQYSNFVSIAHNYAEVLLDFGRTLPGRDDVPVVSRIIMNTFQAKQLLRALNHNIQMYEKNFGAIPEPPQGQTNMPPGGAN
jgi:hypothetical protein